MALCGAGPLQVQRVTRGPGSSVTSWKPSYWRSTVCTRPRMQSTNAFAVSRSRSGLRATSCEQNRWTEAAFYFGMVVSVPKGVRNRLPPLGFWAEALVELRCERFEGVVGPAPAHVGHQHHAEVMLRLHENISQVHLI